MDLRCEAGILHAKLDSGIIEHTCKSRRCGKRPGVVILHRFSAETGELVETLKFKEPTTRKENPDGSGYCISIRSA